LKTFIFLIFREVTRNDVVRTVSLVHGKFYCSCHEDRFTGIPCRHILAIATKDPTVQLNSLRINPRWKINYFVEKENIQDPEELSSYSTISENKNSMREKVIKVTL